MENNFKVNMNEYLPLRDVVFNTLRQAILKGELAPGERLMEIQLAEKLGVSRTPIREAIRKLELEGLVLMLSLIHILMGLVYMGYATVANGRRLGVLFLIAFLAVFGMAVRLLFFLNRRVEKEMVEMGRRRTEAAAGSRQAPPASRLHAPAGSRFCTGCGARLDSDSLFCPSCGKKRSLRPRAAHSEGKQEPAGQTR